MAVDDRNEMFVHQIGADSAVSCRHAQMHCAQHAQLRLVTLLLVESCALYTGKLQQGPCWLPHNFTSIFGLLTWQTCFASCDCFELLRQEPVTTAASCIYFPFPFGL